MDAIAALVVLFVLGMVLILAAAFPVTVFARPAAVEPSGGALLREWINKDLDVPPPPEERA